MSEWVDLELINGGTWSLWADQVVSIADHRYIGEHPGGFRMGARVTLAGNIFGEVVQSRLEVLALLKRVAEIEAGGVAWGFNDTC